MKKCLGKLTMLVGVFIIALVGCISNRPTEQIQGHLLLATGKGLRIVTSESVRSVDLKKRGEGRWSPDGGRLALSLHDPGSSGLVDIAILDLQTGSITTILSGIRSIEPPDWSPDGTSLVFMADAGQGNVDKINLVVVRTDGSDFRVLTNCGDQACCCARWSNDGQKIAFGSSRGLETVDADGRNREVLLQSTNGAIGCLDWSPDDSQIVFLPTTDSSSIIVLTLMDKKAHEIPLVDTVILGSVVWSPEGDEIALAGNFRSYNGKIQDLLKIIDRTGAELVRISLKDLLGGKVLDWSK